MSLKVVVCLYFNMLQNKNIKNVKMRAGQVAGSVCKEVIIMLGLGIYAF